MKKTSLGILRLVFSLRREGMGKYLMERVIRWEHEWESVSEFPAEPVLFSALLPRSAISGQEVKHHQDVIN